MNYKNVNLNVNVNSTYSEDVVVDRDMSRIMQGQKINVQLVIL